MEFVLGAGVRIGEAAVVREAVVDLDAGTVHVNATVVRVNGAGLQIQPRTKTAASERLLHLPPHLVTIIKQRRAAGHPPGPEIWDAAVTAQPDCSVQDRPAAASTALSAALACAGSAASGSQVAAMSSAATG